MTVSVKWKWLTTDWSGLNGGRMTIDDGNGNTFISPAVGYDTNGSWGESAPFDIPAGEYSWSVNNHTIRTSDQGHLKLVELDDEGNEVQELIYVWALQTRMHLDGSSWPNQVYSGTVEIGSADFLHGFEDLRGFIRGKSSGSGVYMRKEAGETKFYVTPNVEDAPSAFVSLGNAEFESIERFTGSQYAVGIGGEIKIVSVSGSSDSASVSSTIPNGGWSKASKIVSNENWAGAGKEIILFDEDGSAYSIGPIENGVLTGTVDSTPINVPAAFHGSDTYVFDAAVVDGYLVVLGRDKNGGSPSIAIWDYQTAAPVVLGNLPVSNVWEINRAYNPFDSSYTWYVSDGENTHSTPNLGDWA